MKINNILSVSYTDNRIFTFYICSRLGNNHPLPYLRIMNRIVSLFFVLMIGFSLKAQQSMQWGMGNQKQFGSLYSRAFSNAACRADSGIQYGFSFLNKYGIQELNDFNAGLFVQKESQQGGLFIWNSGVSNYSQRGVHAAYSRKLDANFWAGLGLTTYQIVVPGFVLENYVSGSLYASGKTGKNTDWAVSVRSLEGWVDTAQPIQPSIDAAISHSFGPFCKSVIEISLDPIYSIQARLGLAYQVQKKWSLQLGFQTKPQTISLGIAYQPGKFRIGWGAMNQNPLGSQMGLTVEKR